MANNDTNYVDFNTNVPLTAGWLNDVGLTVYRLLGTSTGPGSAGGPPTTVAQILTNLGISGGYAPLNSPAFTGTPIAPTPVSLINTTQIPTTAYLVTYYAPLASPTFTGTVTIPTLAITTAATGVTPAAHDNTTKLATTAYVETELASPPTAGIGATTPSPGAFTTLSATGLITPSTTNGIKGTTAADNANTGSVGEYQSANSSGTSLTNLTTATATSISLPAGDWDVWGVVQYVPAGSTIINEVFTGISTTAATLGTYDTYAQSAFGAASASLGETQPTPVVRINVSGATTVYLVAQCAFSTSTCTCNGTIKARRRR